MRYKVTLLDHDSTYVTSDGFRIEDIGEYHSIVKFYTMKNTQNEIEAVFNFDQVISVIPVE